MRGHGWRPRRLRAIYLLHGPKYKFRGLLAVGRPQRPHQHASESASHAPPAAVSAGRGARRGAGWTPATDPANLLAAPPLTNRYRTPACAGGQPPSPAAHGPARYPIGALLGPASAGLAPGTGRPRRRLPAGPIQPVRRRGGGLRPHPANARWGALRSRQARPLRRAAPPRPCPGGHGCSPCTGSHPLSRAHVWRRPACLARLELAGPCTCATGNVPMNNVQSTLALVAWQWSNGQ